MCRLFFFLHTAWLLLAAVESFLIQTTVRSKSFVLDAKKKNKKSDGKGFGRLPVQEDPQPKPSSPAGPPPVVSDVDQGEFLRSVSGGSDAIPKIDESVPVEERTNAILRDKYGLRTMEQQQEEMRRQEKVKEQRKMLEEWKAKADKGEDFDLMAMLPAPLIIAIDGFLKVGVAICTVLFVLGGIAITIEAWSKTSGNPLPEDMDNFISNVVEPNFTPGLFVLLGFSISLGAFSAAQLGSSSAAYREDR